MRRFLCLFAMVALVAPGYAQLGHEIARRHAERAGNRLAGLGAVRAEGRTFINGDVVPFLLVAQRPNRLRVESFTPLRRAVQVYDGVNAPWASHSGSHGGQPRPMGNPDAKEFVANADFDGPLVDFAAKGYSVDYAGEEPIDGRPAYKLLLMNGGDDIFFLWVDTGTAEVVKRLMYRMSHGRRVAMETTFKDFRPVGGVLQPHQIETFANGKSIYVTVIDRMEANPVIPADTFTRPAN